MLSFNLHIILHQGSETILSGLPVQLPVQKPRLPAVPFDAIPAPDVPLHIAKKNFELAETEEEKEELPKSLTDARFQRKERFFIKKI